MTESKTNRIPLDERFLKGFKELLLRFRVPLISSLVCGLAAHMFVFTDKLANWDDVLFLFGKGTTISSGRWGLRLCSFIFPDFSMPWLWGIVSLTLLAVSVCFVISIFGISTPALQVLLAGVSVSFPSVVSIFAFMFASTSYMLAVMLAVVSVYLISRLRNTSGGISLCKYIIPAVLCLTFATGIYQAFFAVAASLLVVLIVRDFLFSDDSTGRIVCRGLMYVAFLAICAAAYFAIMLLSLKITGIGLNGYAEDHIYSDAGIVARLIQMYKIFLSIFVYGTYGIISNTVSFVSHLLLILAGIAAFLLAAAGMKMKPLRFLLCGICIVIFLPVATNCIMLLNPGNSHTIMLYGFTAVYILLVVVTDAGIYILKFARLSEIVRAVAMLSLAAIIAANVLTANKAYLQLKLMTNGDSAFYTSVLTQISNTEGYEAGCRVAAIGTTPYADTVNDSFGLRKLAGYEGYNTRGEIYFENYMMNNLCTDMSFASAEEKSEIADTEKFAEMPCYPDYGYVEKIGDFIVVKLGNEPYEGAFWTDLTTRD